MAAAFNLTAQLNLRGPSNVRQIVSDIRRELGTITGDVNLKVNPQAARNITQLNSAIRVLNDSLVTTRGNANEAANAISAFANAANSINRTTTSASRNINAATTATQKLASSQSKVAKNISRSSSEMEEFGRQAALAVRRFAAYSTAAGAVLSLTGALKSGISAFIDYEKEFVKLQQVTDKTASQLSGLDKEISRLAVGLGVSSDELIKVSSTLAQAGLSARDTQKALQALALTDLAPSFDNLNDTVEGSIALMRQFGIGAGQLEQALGSVNAVAAAFAVESSDLIAAIQRTGGVFASASKGVSDGTQALNEFLAVFTSVRQTTRESAETIATGLRTIFTRIQREDTIEALREYGVSLTDVEGKFVGAYKAVQLLSEGLGRIDPRDLKFSQIVEELGGFRQIGKVIPLIQQFGVAQDALNIAQRGSGSLAKDAVTAQISLSNQIKKVREEFLALIRSIGSGDTFQTLARGALGFASALIKIADSVKGILPILAIIGAGTAARALSRFGTGFVSGLRRTGEEGGGGGPVVGPRPSPIFGGGGSSNTPANLPRDLSLLDDILRNNTRAIDNLRTSLGGVSSALGSMDQFSLAIQANTASLTSNTASLDALTASHATMLSAMSDLSDAIRNSGAGPAAGLNSGGIVRKFARGGVVPGSGNRDTVPAMLMPGEFVIRKKAVETIGTGNLHAMNKYGGGGNVRSGKANKRRKFASGGRAKIADISDIDITDGDTFEALVTPTADPFRAKFRAWNYDAYETGNRQSRVSEDRLNQIKKIPSNKNKQFNKTSGGYLVDPDTRVYGNLTASGAARDATQEFKNLVESKFAKSKEQFISQINKDTDDDGGFGRYKANLGITLPNPEKLTTGRYERKNLGGRIQKFMAGGKAKETRPFGSGSFPFPKRISNAYFKEIDAVLQKEQVNKAFSGGSFLEYPEEYRLRVDPSEAKTSFDAMPFDRSSFMESFKKRISTQSLYKNMSNFAKFIGLPQEDLSLVLPENIDFSKMGGLGPLGQFDRTAMGKQGITGYDLSASGYTQADEQDLYGLNKLLEEKRKEIKKVIKTPVQTFPDGSFRYDESAAQKIWDEINDLDMKALQIKKKKSIAEEAARVAIQDTAKQTGRGAVSINSGMLVPAKNDTFYHELTHQLFQGLRTRSSETFDKYKSRVVSLFEGDNNDLADAFDALENSYNSADVVYGRSYKIGLLDQVIQQNRSINRGSRPAQTPEAAADATNFWAQSLGIKKAREFKPINPDVNKTLLNNSISQSIIDRVEDSGKEEFLTTLVQNAPKLDSNLQGILDSTLNDLLGTAGIKRQQYAVGGKVERKIGIVDTDVLRDPANASIVGPAMEKLGLTSVSQYSIELGRLAAQARKEKSLSKLTAIAGAAGSGKSSLATGRGTIDDASLRKTMRSQILSPEDIAKVNEVIVLTSTASEDKLEAYLRDVDRAYILSSSTEAERKKIEANREKRDITGEGLYGRKPGSTTGASRDFTLEESILRDELGSRAMVLGRKEGSFGLRRKKQSELPEIVQAGGFYTGGFAPPTRGHKGAFDTLLSNMLAKNPNASAEDILVSVAPNLPMSGGEGDTEAEKLAHASRYGIFPADFRALLAGINFPGGMISTQETPAGSLPKMMEVQGSGNRRRFARIRGALAITSGKEEGVLGKYERAGVNVTDIPRIDDISATKVRKAIFDGDDSALTSFLSPDVASILMGNRAQLRNRSTMVPMLIEEIKKYAQTQKDQVNSEIQALLASAPGGPYTRVTEDVRKNAPEVAMQIKNMREQRDRVTQGLLGYRAHNIISLLSSKYPDMYGLDASRRSQISAVPADITKDMISTQLSEAMGSEFGVIPQTGPTSSLQQAILEKVTKQTAAPKGSGELPTTTKEILAKLGDRVLPSDPKFGEFAGKRIRDTAKNNRLGYWATNYAPTLLEKPEKLATYIAARDYVKNLYSGAATQTTSQALATAQEDISQSTLLAMVGLYGKNGLNGPLTWNLGKNAQGEDVSMTATIMERVLPKEYAGVSEYISSQTSGIVATAAEMMGKKDPKTLSKKQKEILNQGNIEGGILEQLLAVLGGDVLDDAVRTRAVDFPSGIGDFAANIFGIPSNIPTEAKRTINSDSRTDAIEEFQRHFRGVYGIPEPQKLASGGKVNPLLEKYKSIIASIMPKEYIGKDGFLTTPEGESYKTSVISQSFFDRPLTSLFKPQRSSYTGKQASVLVNKLKDNADLFDNNDLNKIIDLVNQQMSVSSTITIPKGKEQDLAHETFHDIQGYLYKYYPDVIQKLNTTVFKYQKEFEKVYSSSVVKDRYPLERILPKTYKKSAYPDAYIQAGENLAKKFPKSAEGILRSTEAANIQYSNDEIIPLLLSASQQNDANATQLLQKIFTESGLNSTFRDTMPEGFFWGGKVDPLAKKYGLSQKEFLSQKKISDAMGLDQSQLEEKLSLYAAQKRRLQEKKFSALDATADASVAGKQVTEQQKALEEYIKGNRFASGGAVKLYHGSNTGVNDNVLKSFKEKGALSNIATGYGQGSGFYFYTEKERAIDQAKMRVRGGNFETRVSGDTSGRPMVLTFQEMLDAQNYDLDYELQKKLVTDWVYNNFDRAQSILNSQKNPLVSLLSKTDKNPELGIMSSGIRLQEGDQTLKSEDGTEYTVKGGSRRTIYSGTSGDVREGELLSKLMSGLRTGDPELVKTFEEQLFAKPYGLALKYVGSNPLKPINYEFFANGGSPQDTVPALLTPGEFVINKKAAERIGYGRLERLNKADKIKGFNKGGFVGVQKFAAGGRAAPGDEEAAIQRLMIEFENLAKSVRDNYYASARAAGATAAEAKARADYAATVAVQGTSIVRLVGATEDAARQIHEAVRRVERDMADRRRPPTPPAPIDPARRERESDEYIRLQARLRGISESRYRNEIRKQGVARGAELRENLPTEIDKFRSRVYQLRDTVSGPAGETRTNAIDELKTMLKEISGPGIGEAQIDSALESLASNLNNTSLSFGEAINSTSSLIDIFNRAGDEGAIFERVIGEMSAATNISADTLRGMFNPASIEAAVTARRNRQSIDLFVSRINRAALTLGALGSTVSKIMQAPENRSATVSSAGISAALGGTGEALAFGGQIAANIRQLSELSGEAGAIGALGGGAEAIMGMIANPYVAAAAIVSGALYGLASGIKDATNAAREFDKNLANKNIELSLERVNRLFDDFAKDRKNTRLLKDIDKEINKAISSAIASARIDIEVPKAFWVNLLDVLSSSNGRQAAERSNILENQGISAYFESTAFGQFLQGNIFNAGQEANRVREFYSGINAPEIARQQSATFKPMTDALMKESEERLRSGEDFTNILNELRNGSNPTNVAETLARSNPVIQEQMIRIESSNIPEQEKRARINQLVLLEAEYRLRLNMQRVLREVEMERLANATRKFVTSVERMLSNMDRAINKVTFQLDKMTQTAELSNAALSGQAKAGNVSLDSINILQNRKAYSQERQNFAVNQAAEMFGPAAGIIKPLLNISETMEDTVLSTINRVIQENPGSEPGNEKIAGAIRASLNTALSDIGLPDNLSDKMSEQVQNAFAELRQKQDDNTVSFDQLVEKVPQLSQAIDTAKAAQERAIKALEFWQKSVNDYASAMNQAVDYQIEANSRFRKSSSIESKGSVELARTLGKVITLTDQFAQSRRDIASQTGGLANPRAIENNILMLENRRRTQQELSDNAANAGLGGRNELVIMQSRLRLTNIALRENYDALKNMAESGDLASAALAKLSEIEQKRQAGVSFIEKLVTSDATELDSFNRALNRLNNNMKGNTNPTATAQDRSESLQAFNMIAPFLGPQQNELKANVLESMLMESGIGVGGFANDIIKSLRNPEASAEAREAINFYNEAIKLQSEANTALGRISVLMAENTAEIAAQKLATAIREVPLSFESQALNEIRNGINRLVDIVGGKGVMTPETKAYGGLIYAAGGNYIDFKAKGTDTVPAMLTPGEFVVNKKATSKNLPLLKQINDGTSYYANGGIVIDGIGANKGKWAKSGYDPSKAAEERKKQDLETKHAYPLIKDLAKAKIYNSMTSVFSSPSTYYAESKSLGSLGESFMQSADNSDRFFRKNSIEAKPGIGPSKFSVRMDRFDSNPNIEGKPVETANSNLKQIGFIPDYLDSIFDNPLKYSKISKKQINDYRLAYEHLVSKLQLSKNIYDIKQNDISNQQSEARRALESSVALQVRPRGIFDSGEATLSGLTYQVRNGKSNFFFMGKGSSKPKLGDVSGDKGGILGINQSKPWYRFYTDGIDHTVVAGVKSMNSTIGTLIDNNSIAYDVASLSSGGDDIAQRAILAKNLGSTLEANLSKLTNDTLVESDISLGKKALVSKLEDLYYKRIFEAEFGSELLNSINGIQLPLTLYNIDKDNWLDNLSSQSPDQRGKRFSWNDDDFISLSPVADATNPSPLARIFPWVSRDFRDEAIFENAKRKFAENRPKPVNVSTKVYGTEGSGDLNIVYDEVSAYPFDKKTGQFDYAKQMKYLVVKQSRQDSTFNPGSPLGDLREGSSLYWSGSDIEGLAQYIRERTPSFDPKTGKEIPPKLGTGYVYPFLTMGSGIIDSLQPDDSTLLNNNLTYRSLSEGEKQDLIIKYGPDAFGLKSISLVSPRYKNNAAKRLQMSRDKGVTQKVTGFGDMILDKGLGETFTPAKRVTLAREFYKLLNPTLAIGGTAPTKLSDVSSIAQDLNSRLEAISKGPGKNSLEYAQTMAGAAIFSSMYNPGPGIDSYFKRMGIPLKDSDYVGAVPPPRDPTKPFRSNIDYYSGFSKGNNLNKIIASLQLISQRELDYRRGNEATTQRLTPEGRERATAIAERFQEANIGRDTGDILYGDPKKQQEIRSYQDIEKLALNPYSIPKSYTDRQDLLDELYDYYKMDRDENGQPVWPENRWKFIGANTPAVANPNIADASNAKQPNNIREWYAIQDRIINSGKNKEDILEQIDILTNDKLGNKYLSSNIIDKFSDKAQEWNAYLTGNLYGFLPKYNYMLGWLRDKSEPNIAAVNKSAGGVIYASTGKYIDFKPKGTDTIPAMLTPGEFVVNKQATQKNLPLLQQMNKGGNVIYRANGSKKPEGTLEPVTIDGVSFPKSTKSDLQRRLGKIPYDAWITGTAAEEYQKILDAEIKQASSNNRPRRGMGSYDYREDRKNKEYTRDLAQKMMSFGVTTEEEDREIENFARGAFNTSDDTKPRYKRGQSSITINPKDLKPLYGSPTPLMNFEAQSSTSNEIFKTLGQIVAYDAGQRLLQILRSDRKTTAFPLERLTTRTKSEVESYLAKLEQSKYDPFPYQEKGLDSKINDIVKQYGVENTKQFTAKNRIPLTTAGGYSFFDPKYGYIANTMDVELAAIALRKVKQQNKPSAVPMTGSLTVSGRSSNQTIVNDKNGPQTFSLKPSDANANVKKDPSVLNRSRVWYNGKLWDQNRDGKETSDEKLIGYLDDVSLDGDVRIIRDKDWGYGKVMRLDAKNFAKYSTQEDRDIVQQWLNLGKKKSPAAIEPRKFVNGGLVYAQNGVYLGNNQTFSLGRPIRSNPSLTVSGSGSSRLVAPQRPAQKQGFGTGKPPKNAGLLTTSGTKPIIMTTDLNNIDPMTNKPMVYGPPGFPSLIRSGQTPPPPTIDSLKTSRVWYGGKLWDQNRDGKESPNEQLIGTLDDVAMDGDVRIIRDKDWGYGKVLRLDPRNFAKYSTPEDKAIVQAWLNLGKKKSPAAIEPSRRNVQYRANGGMIYAADGKMINFQSQGTDTIPAMLTPGEFVVNKSATKKNLPLLQNINSGNYLADGGLSFGNLGMQTTTSGGNQTINAGNQLYRKDKTLEEMIDEAYGLGVSAFNALNAAIPKSQDELEVAIMGLASKVIPGIFSVLGGSLGVLAGSALTAPIGGVGGIPVGIAGAIGGELVGQKVNKFLWSLFKDTPMYNRLEDNIKKYPDDYAAGQFIGWGAELFSGVAFGHAIQEGLKKAGTNALNSTVSKLGISKETVKLPIPSPAGGVIDDAVARGVEKNFSREVIKEYFIDRTKQAVNDTMIDTENYRLGGLIYASNGRYINFEPKGTDTVPAMLTPGEFVVNRKATQNNLSLLKEINSGSYSRGDIVRKFNKGGFVNPNYYQMGGNVNKGDRSNNFDFGSFMQRLMGQLSSIIGTSIREGLQARNNAQNVQQTPNGVSIDSKTLNSIGELTNRLKSIADTLAGLNGIPSEIKVTGRHDVNVIINGDSVLNKLSPEIQDIVMSEIKNSFQKLINANKPMPSDKLINPFDLPQSPNT